MSITKEQISRSMRSNKSKDTGPELILRKELWRRGLRYRKNYKYVTGTPDIVFMKAHVAIFIDGKFWHGYDWENQKNKLKNNRDFWIEKIERNMKRDVEVTRRLTEIGWIVLRFWDFDVTKNVKACADKIEQVCNDRTQ